MEAAPSTQPRRRTVTAVAAVTRPMHNIHPLGLNGRISYCVNGSCDRGGDFAFLARRAEQEFGCVLVRPDVTVPSQVDNDDNDPNQPTYQEDYQAYDMISKLETEKLELQRELVKSKQCMQHSEERISALQSQLETLKQCKQESVKLQRQLASAKKIEVDLKMQMNSARTMHAEECRQLHW